jgi:hypothetical protein
MTPSEVLLAVARAEFRWPTDLEREMFPGFKSQSWMIASLNNYVPAIIDGDFIEIYKGKDIYQFQVLRADGLLED